MREDLLREAERLSGRDPAAAQPPAALTGRETDVLALVPPGRTVLFSVAPSGTASR
ncbi:hypothetical protein [Actinomadura nitritigenes]|uniref:hypothetical protein n=1 Tax=Actinomadura nitritigenes TaxID=134602 RepID=UPI003D8C1E7B